MLSKIFELLRQHKTASAAIVGSLLALSAISIWTNHQVDAAQKQVVAAQEAVKIARESADRAAETAKQVAEQTKQTIEDANRRADQALELARQAQARERDAILALGQIRQRRQEDLSQVPAESDSELSAGTRTLARKLYPDKEVSLRRDATGFVMNRDGAEAFKMSLIEVSSLRQENSQLQELANERQKQISGLTEALHQSNVKIDALTRRVAAMEDQAKAYLDERSAMNRHIDALESQVKALKRQSLFRTWKGRSLAAGAFLAGIYLGRAL